MLRPSNNEWLLALLPLFGEVLHHNVLPHVGPDSSVSPKQTQTQPNKRGVSEGIGATVLRMG